MFEWLKSGIISSYFWIIALVNFIIISGGIMSFSFMFRKNISKRNKVIHAILTVLMIIIATVWFPMAWNS